MAAIQSGIAVVFGTGGISSLKTGTTAAGASAKTFAIVDYSITKRSQKEETVDADGDVVNVTYYDFASDLTLQVYPYASSIADAKTNNAMPTVGQVLVIESSANSEEADLASTTGVAWSITGVSKNRSNTSKATITIQATRWGAISSHDNL